MRRAATVASLIGFVMTAEFAHAEGAGVADQPAEPLAELVGVAESDEGRLFNLGLGLRSPDGLLLEGSTRLSTNGRLRIGLGLPLGIKLTENQAPEIDSFFGVVTVATPPTSVDVSVRYGPNFSVDYMHFPMPSMTSFYVAGGLLYYTAKATAEKASILLLCFDVSVTCDSTTATYKTTGQVHVDAVAKTSGFKVKAGAGWFWEIGKRAFIDLTAAGIAVSMSVKRDVDVDSSLDDDPALSRLAKEQAQFVLEEKEAKLANLAKSKMEKYDRRVLPFAGVVAGVSF